ncbi:PaaI family thioesterase [Variovorax sp. J22R133]|uniref:PaaI family thioesterase n=1 Tax=Variovorax brevis TaxID=3053503 RepID=UPI0025778E7B|nr:PaaI family thioesterase [Variovorax sp. J22R133]MDM0115310.1 PaaI family thioesterase [Variovorax sp. J22R133]
MTPHIAFLRNAVLAMPMAKTLQLSFLRIEPGHVELEMPVLDAFCFRPGQLQATAVFAIADFAAVAAAGTLLEPGWINATIDGTLKLVAPARGTHLRARGRVVDAARLLTVCAADVYAVDGTAETLCATLLGTARNIDGSRH